MKNIISISDFDAKQDGTLQTTQIQAAIDYCFSLGGGEVVIPSGTYMTGGIRLRSNVTLHLMQNAVLRGSRDPMDYFEYLNDKIEPLKENQITDAGYVGLWTIHGETAYDENDPRYRFKRIPGSRWNNALIRAIDAENVSIIGEKGSVIDGNNCYDEIGEELYRGPHAICFFNVRNIYLNGYTVMNSANWAHNMLFCENIHADGIRMEAGHDGFDAAVCRNVTIENSEFHTGDDCIAGFGNTNVLIHNCLLNSSCSALRFGGTNVVIKKCKAFAPGKYAFRGSLTEEEKKNGAIATAQNARNNMLSFFTYYADYSVPIPDEPGNIIIEDCEINGADRFLHYNFSGNETWQRYRPLDNISFRNIRATNISMPLTLYGTKEHPVSLELKNISIETTPNTQVTALINACQYSRIVIRDLTLKGPTIGCLILSHGVQGKIEIDQINGLSDCSRYVMETEKNFVIQSI